MSAATATAPLPRPRAARRDPGVVEAPPVWESTEDLALTERTRQRMLRALLALLGDSGLAGASDSMRTAAVVLAARTNAATLQVELTAGELGRWVGVSRQTVCTQVRPRLQSAVRSTDVEASPAPGAERGRTRGIRWEVEALRRARHEGRLDDPLRLSRPEFAVLWRLCEAVFGPGWVHRDGSVTEPGLLGRRTGGGAATDRLALLLLVLSARPDGSVRLCPGAVQRRYGRAAATTGRLLGCQAAGGRAVLERLVAEGVVELPGGWQGRLVVPAVRDAHERLRSARRVQGRPGGRFFAPRPSDGSVPRDQIPPQAPSVTSESQVTGGQDAPAEADFGSDGSVSLHADHAPEAEGVVDGADDGGGCSGSAVDGQGGRRGDARGREDQHADRDQAGADVTAAGAPGGGPLRGDQPQPDISPAKISNNGGSSSGRGVPAGAGGPQIPGDLLLALDGIEPLWRRLTSDGARAVAARAVRDELRRAADVVAADSPEQAAELAQLVIGRRLERRLAMQGGPERVRDVIGWLRARGLPRRGCSDPRCDDGVLLGAGGKCTNCSDVAGYRRGQRCVIEAAVAAELPGATDAERRAETERRLHAQVTADAAETVRRHQRDAELHAEQQEMHARAAACRAAEAEAQQALPCEDCGAPGSGGLCGTCASRRQVAGLRDEFVMTVVAGQVTDPTHSGEVTRLLAQARATVDLELERARVQARSRGADDAMTMAAVWLTASNLVHDARFRALAFLGGAPAARAEAAAARTTSLLSHGPAAGTRDEARAAAEHVAAAARTRTAEYLLHNRTVAIQETLNPAPAPAPAPASRCTGHGGTCTGRAVGRSALCLDCRAGTGATTSPATATAPVVPRCPGWDGTPCGRPNRHGLCVRCRAKSLPVAAGAR